MEELQANSWLSLPVDEERDHILGPHDAPITLVEYGGYVCPHCRAVHTQIAALRKDFGERLRYVFRHRPIPGDDLARRASELAERAEDEDSFWKAHFSLMSRSDKLSEEDLEAVAVDRGWSPAREDGASAARARARVEEDERSARESGVMVTPTFFINGRRYDGPWDEASLADAMEGRFGHRMRAAALDFAAWGPSAGVLLLLATVLAVVLTNSPWSESFQAIWEQNFGVAIGEAAFVLDWLHWINDGLLTIFFLVVGLEIKREFTVGHLASAKSASLPVAAALGGMVVPALIYMLFIPPGAWEHGWGVPMATDTAFAIALIVMLGQRVPVELRVFLTAAAIVDDIGAILVVAAFYSEGLNPGYLGAALLIMGALAILNTSHIYRLLPYLLLGLALWACVRAGGLHATLAGVLLAIFIPTRPPPNLQGLMNQANLILSEEEKRGREEGEYRVSLPALIALEDIHRRLESPAARLLRRAGARSSYLVLPLFALANAGVSISGDIWSNEYEPLIIAIVAGLALGKPMGIVGASALAVGLGLARKPDSYTWRQLMGAGALAGIGFTMSLFIAGQAFPMAEDFAAAKIAVFAASLLSAVAGVLVLWKAGPAAGKGEET